LKYQSEYRLPDIDDKGYLSRDEYLLVNCVGYYEFDEPYGATYRKYGRKDYYLSYNYSGTMKVKANGEEHKLEGGTVLIYKPNEEQYYGQANKYPISNYWVHFTGYGAAELLLKANLDNGSIFQIDINNEIPVLFEKIMNEVGDKKYYYEYTSAAFLINIIFEISRRLQFTNANKHESDREKRINQSVSFIHKNYSKNITITELSNMAGITVNYYSNVFKELIGVSPMQYIINFRLQKAKELMCYSNLNIRQIASLVGFDDQLYFSRLFKKYENLSPLDFIKNRRTRINGQY